MEDQVSDNFQSDNLCERAKAVNFEEKNEGSRVAGQPFKRRKIGLVAGKRRSYVWEHFDVLAGEKGNLHAQCKYCENTNYRAEDYWGTSNCRRHLTICNAYKASVAKNPLHCTCATKAKTPDCAGEFNQQVYTNMFADAIVSHGYPLSIVEHEGMRKLHAYLNPKVNTISRNTISKKVEALATTRNVVEKNGGKVDVDCGFDAESLECDSVCT